MLKLKKQIRKKDNTVISRKGNVFSDIRGVSTLDIIIIIVAVIIIIVSVILLISNISTLKKVNSEIEEIKASIAVKEQTLNQLIELGNNEDALKADYERNKLYIPNERDDIGITADTTKIVQNANGVFRRISFSDEIVLENGTVDIPFAIRVDCTYEVLGEIIDELGKTNRLYIIESIDIVNSNPNSEELNADIVMHAYYKTD